jgi:glycosyltransferase involved in cell wall biosynthesis
MKSARSTHQPLVSIILCTFNRAHLVLRAVESVFRQTYGRWELIIVDDGSSDDTMRVVLPLVMADARLHLLRHANKGLALSRNDGLALAAGEFVTFLDSDDEYRPNHLATRVRFMRRRPDVGLAYGGLECVGPRERQFVPDVERPGKSIHVSKCFASGTIFARTSAFRTLGGFRDVVFAEDHDLMRRLKRRTRIARVRARTYVYHCETENRLCDLYEEGGEEAIRRFRAGGREGV